MSDNKQQWMRIVAKAWADEEFKDRLLSDPAAVLAEEGLVVPEGKKIRFVETAADEALFVLPAQVEGEPLEKVEERIAALGGW